MPLTVALRPRPQSGARAPFDAGGFAIRAAVSEFRPHVVQQKIGEGMKGLVAQFLEWIVAAGLHFRQVTGAAIELTEDRLAALDGGIGHTAPRRGTKAAEIALHAVHDECVGFRFPTVGKGSEFRGLSGRVILFEMSAG